MPGFVGIICPSSAERCHQTIRAMLPFLSSCVEPSLGDASVPEASLAFGWAAHPDSFAERASSLEAAPHLSGAFSGECFAADSAELPDGQIDLLQCYQREGASFVGKLNGLFAGLVVDSQTGEALLFNDRYGMERIYVCQYGDAWLFASEAKALLSVIPTSRAFDDDGVAEWLAYGSVSGERTLFRGIRLLPAGSLWTFRHGQLVEQKRYFDPQRRTEQPPLNPVAFKEAFISTWRRVLPRYAQGRNSIGMSLTGGLDTRLIMAYLPASVQPICYTYVDGRGTTLDARIGKRVAALCGLEHRLLRLDTDFFTKFADHVDKTVYTSDGCAGATATHELYLSEQARALAPVRLTGNYGGEVMRCMSTYKPLGLDDALLANDFRQRVTAMSSAASGDRSGPKWGAFHEAPAHLAGLRIVAASALTFRTPFLDNELVDLTLDAPAACLSSSIPSLEVINNANPALATLPTDRAVAWPPRGPLYLARRFLSEVLFKLDYEANSGTSRLLSATSRIGLKGASCLGVYTPHRFLMYRDWFRQELQDYVRDVLASDCARHMPYWNGARLETVGDEHITAKGNRTAEINAVLSLVAIERNLLKNREYQDPWNNG